MAAGRIHTRRPGALRRAVGVGVAGIAIFAVAAPGTASAAVTATRSVASVAGFSDGYNSAYGSRADVSGRMTFTLNSPSGGNGRERGYINAPMSEGDTAWMSVSKFKTSASALGRYSRLAAMDNYEDGVASDNVVSLHRNTDNRIHATAQSYGVQSARWVGVSLDSGVDVSDLRERDVELKVLLGGNATGEYARPGSPGKGRLELYVDGVLKAAADGKTHERANGPMVKTRWGLTAINNTLSNSFSHSMASVTLSPQRALYGGAAPAPAPIATPVPTPVPTPAPVEPAPAPTPVEPAPFPGGQLLAGLEDGTFSEVSDTTDALGTIATTTERAYEGVRSAKAQYEGGGSNGYANLVESVAWSPGDTVTYGAAVYLPRGFKADMGGAVTLMRWDNWPQLGANADFGGISIWNSDKKLHVTRGNLTTGSTGDVVGGVSLAEGVWSHIEVRQTLSATSSARTEVYVNGALKASSSSPNSFGRPVQRMRYGIVSIASGAQTKPLTMYVDRVSAGRALAGPRR